MFHAASEGLEERLWTGRPISGYNGFDPSAAVAPYRPPGPDLGADPLPAARRPPDRDRRRRDRHDRRSVRAIQRAEPARSGDARGERRVDQAPARALPGFRRPERGAGRQQPRLARIDVADRLPAGHRQALHGPVHAGQGFGPGPARARPVVHRVQLHAPPVGGLRAPPSDPRRASCRWAGPTSGGTSRPASSSSAGPARQGRPRPLLRPTASRTRCCSPRQGRSSARARAAMRSGSIRH